MTINYEGLPYSILFTLILFVVSFFIFRFSIAFIVGKYIPLKNMLFANFLLIILIIVSITLYFLGYSSLYSFFGGTILWFIIFPLILDIDFFDIIKTSFVYGIILVVLGLLFQTFLKGIIF